jgi:hypothetical protein
MRAGVSAAIVAASLLGSGTAFSTCPPGQAHTGQLRPGQSNNCLDLNFVPRISQEIVAGEHLAAPPKTAPAAAPTPAYTGPTVGVSRTVRQAPTVGYRWSID